MSEGDIRVTIKTRNARILRRIEAQDFKTVKSFCDKYQLPYGRINEIICMRIAPVKKDGEWIPHAWFLASALQCEPEDLWPDWLKTIERRRATISFDANIEELARIPAESSIDLSAVPKLLGSLPPRQREAVERIVMGDEKVEDVAATFGTSRTRTYQIKEQGLRRMRERARTLKITP